MTEKNPQIASDVDLDSYVSLKSVHEFIEHLKRSDSLKECRTKQKDSKSHAIFPEAFIPVA